MANENSTVASYDPRAIRLMTFYDAAIRFRDGSQTPRAYLESCLERIEEREPAVMAFVCLNVEGARHAADRSTERFRANRPISPVDGLPIGVKDLFDTADMPTQMNSPIFEGWQPRHDAACVYGLRTGGAVILGKTVTAEFGVQKLGPTRNPFNPQHSPGGSSSGSAAAVGAAMIPAAIGSQARGSVLRPASYCGNFALKPTFGTIHTGGYHHSSESMQHIGIHAGSLKDAWTICRYTSACGSHPGYPGMTGGMTLPEPAKPQILARIDTLGWCDTDSSTRDAFEHFIEGLRHHGVEVLTATDHPVIAAFDSELTSINEFLLDIVAYELRWPFLELREKSREQLSNIILDRLSRTDSISAEDYAVALQRRETFRARQQAVENIADGFVTLNADGPPPKWDIISSPVYGDVSSAAGAPAFNLPFLAVNELPVGVQLMGFPGKDHRLAAHANWLTATFLFADRP